MTTPGDNIPNEIAALLPWYANGTLTADETRKVEAALARDPALVAELAAIREEAAETIHLNETLGAPSSRAMHALFAAIDAEPPRQATGRSLSSRILGFFATLSPRALASAAAAAAVVVVLQAAVIGQLAGVFGGHGYQTASYQQSAVAGGTQALVRFAADARMSDINDLLTAYRANVVDGPKAGMFRIAIGSKPLSMEERAQLIARLQAEKIVGFAAAAE